LEAIRDLLVHEGTKTTTEYLSLNLDDQDNAMRKLAKNQSAVKYRVGQNAGCEK
jgi:hypothetical protein